MNSEATGRAATHGSVRITPGLPKISQSQRDDAFITPYRATQRKRWYYHRRRQYYYYYCHYYFFVIVGIRSPLMRGRTTTLSQVPLRWLTIKLPVYYAVFTSPVKVSRCARRLHRPVVICRREPTACMSVCLSTSASARAIAKQARTRRTWTGETLSIRWKK